MWGDGWKSVMDLIDATDESTILEHNMYVRHPVSLSQGHWGQGRVTLVGDAAHPLRPASGAFATALHCVVLHCKASQAQHTASAVLYCDLCCNESLLRAPELCCTFVSIFPHNAAHFYIIQRMQSTV